jgi:hypothetical protein
VGSVGNRVCLVDPTNSTQHNMSERVALHEIMLRENQSLVGSCYTIRNKAYIQ